MLALQFWVYIIAAANAVLNVYMLFKTVKHLRPSSAYWLGSLVFLTLPMMVPSSIDLSMHGYHQLAPESIGKALAFGTAFNALVAFGYLLRIRNNSKFVLPSNFSGYEPHLKKMVVVYIGAAVAVAVASAGSLADVGDYRWSEFALRSEGQSQTWFLAAVSAYLIASAVILIAFLQRRYWLVVLCATVALTVSQFHGSRVFALAALVPIILLCIRRTWAGDYRSASRITSVGLVKRVIVSITVVIGGAIALSFAIFARTQSPAMLLGSVDILVAEFYETFKVEADPSTDTLLYVVETFPSVYPYLDGVTYQQMFLIPVPGVILRALGLGHLKERDYSGTFLAKAIFGSSSGLARFASIHPTIWGDAYANFGPLGVFVGALWGCGLVELDRRLRLDRLSSVALYPAIWSNMVILVRGSMIHAIQFMIMPALLVWVVGIGFKLLFRRGVYKAERRKFGTDVLGLVNSGSKVNEVASRYSLNAVRASGSLPAELEGSYGVRSRAIRPGDR